MHISRVVVTGGALVVFGLVTLSSASCAGGSGGFVDLSDAAIFFPDGGSPPVLPTSQPTTGPTTPTIPLACASNQKLCAGACVSNNDPKYGCASASCTPCRAQTGLSALCQRGACAWQNCTLGADCDGDPGNGCETLIWADPDNCGGCNIKCTFASGKGTCSSSKCVDNGCNEGWTDCNGNPSDGCEVRTGGSDAKNCGACGRVCATGVCTAGLCEGEVVTRTASYSAPTAIAISGGTLYYATGSNSASLRKIASVPTGGGASTELLAANAGYVEDIAVDGGEIFVADDGNGVGAGRVYKLPASGACSSPDCPIMLAEGRNFPSALLVDATYVYWIESGYYNQDNGGLYRKRRDNTGSIDTLGSLTKFPRKLLPDGSNNGFFIALGLGFLEHVSLDGATRTPVLNESGTEIGGAMTSLAVSGDRLFFSTPTLASGQIASMPKAGGALMGIGDIPAAAIVPDGDMLYAIGQNPEERRVVFAIPKSGTCNPTTPCPVRIAKYDYRSSNESQRPLAVDASHVYWIENVELGGDGAIRRIAK